MNILVTGSAGALGRNLVENLKAIRDGKNRTRPNLSIDKIYEYDIYNTLEELDKFSGEADFVVHAAGVNRPKETSEFMEGNFGFTSTLLDSLKRHNNKAPILITSSVQATLSGRFGNSEYGRSKLAGEELMFQYGEKTGSPVYVYRFENMVGKWIKPRYNSAVGTFCYCIARGEPITVNDPTVHMEMVFFDDICEEIYDAMEGHPHRCHYEGVEAISDENGRYCHCPVKYHATLGEIVELLHKFHDFPSDFIVPRLEVGSFEKKLHAMYLSYLPKEATVFDYKMNVDQRGSFTELIRTLDCGQVSVNISKPGIKKGEHWHDEKAEIFIVVHGHGLVQMRDLNTGEIEEYEVSGDHIQGVWMKPGWTHNIINLSDAEDLVTIMYATELLNKDRPDTYFEPVKE
ncbi:NAD-dependent epimerase/dehydratase family protein [Ruminococcus sp.]|uniref:polysaccharide biosynthesis C-terminal domain-containing protein n=1 Tax=Ruminococcus sp. TaxID=41978 RepID=UPI0025F81850|nr:NAD-dependent epimerase/dehydratase family protein [Ruminococcus sp.]MBR1431524.1 NAD-dependent epimerase/dehydratase family protein [Ruminococcus sp.]